MRILIFSKDIIIDERIMLKNKLPILYKDPSWDKLFGNTDDKDIRNAKEEQIGRASCRERV